ncbi:MAG: Cna B-type domain-containing protein [Clostridiales bacterium]|nr:Cna B-type domain-containing protein [Clostridiales bacterium]
MNRKLMELAEKYVAQRKRRMRLLKTVTALALVVAICTSYVLMMPGLTMAAETYCGLEEHTHTADCYVDELTCLISEREAETVFTDIMRCSFEPHHHSSDCYNAQGELSCGYWDGYIHEHDEKCYDSNGVLICTLEEHPMHKHTDACYNWEKQLTCTLPESEGHIHTDTCYRAKEPTCGLFENEGHQHTADCVTETRTLICTEDVATNSDMPHVHDDSCYEVTRTYTCGLTEGEGAHHHTDACYPTTEEPTCGLFEGEGAHTHDDSCYEMVRGDLKCKLYPDPAKVHTHSASCVDAKTGYYTCGYIQVLRHQHTNECVVTVTAEDSGHHHTADCYERHYICGKEEHTHTADCYYDPTPNPDATAAPEATAEPTAAPEVTAEPTAAPEVTAEPTVAPEVTDEPTAAPEATAEPTAAPEATAEPTAAPEVTDEPTEAPTATPAPTEEPTLAPTVTPTPTENAAETAAPMDEPSPTPALTVIPSMNADAAKPDDMMMPSLELDPGFLMMANEPPAVSESGMQITNITVSNIILPENANAYNYSFAAGFKISDEAILRHGEGNKIIIPAENTHIKTDSTSVWSGTDAKFSNEKPAFKFQYNPETNNVEMWFTDEYMDFVRNNPSHDDRTGTMKMSAEIRKDDVENLGNDDLTIKFGGASTTVKWEDIDRGNNSLLSDLRTWKSGANVNWEKGTIEYTVKIESTKGTNGKNATAQDVMTAVNKQLALTNMTVTEVKTNANWSQVPAVGSASTEIKTDGTCACGTTGTHIHYVYTNTTDESGKVYTMTTDYVLPPLSANETYEIKYEYTFDKDGMTGEYDQLTNTFAAQSGGKWDHSQNSSNSNPTDVQIKKLQKSSWYNSNEGCIQWTLTVNENRFNIKDKTLTDTMFDQLVDENGSLLFSKTDGKGYVSQITANNTPITAENYTDYFTVETGVDGKPQLKFKDTTAKIVIQYKTPVEATAQNQQITNTAEFDGEQKTSTATVGQDTRYNVVKSVDASMPADPTKNGEYTDGLYPVAWNATYTFPATMGVSYKLNFGDTLDKKVEWKNGTEIMQHYMTAAQAQTLLNDIKNLDVVKKHDAQNVPYTITLLTCDSQGKNEGTMVVSAETTLTEGYYYGFRFETTGEGVVLNDANTDVNATTSVTLPYQTTIYLEKSRTGWVDFKNTAVNAGKNGDAWYKAAPNDLVEKKFGNHGVGDLNGQIIHENELYWTILLRNDGVAHDEITLTETLPPHIVVDYIEYGRSRLILSETDSTKMTVVNKKLDNAGTIPNGYEVSNEWSEQRISIKADLTTVGEGAQQQQRINISMKPNENTGGSETILNGKADMTVKVHCKIADDFLANAVNGSLKLGVLNNQLDVEYDAALYHKEQKTELTYEEETVKAVNVQKGYSVKGGDQQARITYTIDINQAGAELSPSSSTLTLTDTLSYDVVGWCNNWPNNYIYLRDVTLDEGSFRLYEALKDENGNPILNVDENGKGHLVRGAEIEKYLWKMEFTETEEGNKTYQYPAQGTPSFSGSTVNTRKLNITVTVPDGKALILEYTAQENILLPPEVTNEYNFNDVNHKGISPALKNHANLEGKDSSSTELNNSNNDYFSQGGGYIHNNLVIRKVDSANTSLLLPGTEFTLYAWNTATNKFEAVGGENGKVYTDQNGMITYQYNSEKLNERPLDPNVAYMLAETDAVEPYHLVLEDRPLVVFHIVPRADDPEEHPARYPDGLNNGNFGTISKSRLQELMTASGIKGVVDGPHTVNGSASINIQVKNSKDRHDMEVQKNWAGDDAHENARPASVLVMLRRYVLTQEQYTDVLNTGATQNPQCILSAEMKGNSSASIARQFPENQEVTVTLNLSGNGLGDTGRIVARVDGKQIVLQPQDTSKKQFVYTTTMAYQKKVTFSVQWWQSWNNQWSADYGYDDSVSITMTPEGTPVDEVPTQVTQFTDAQWAKIRQHPDDAYGGREATLTAANGWHTKWSQLESTGADANGNKLYYIYYIVEGKVPSYTTSGITYTIDPNASKTTGTVTATLTNVYRPEDKYGEISIDLSKEWYAPDGTKHTITEEFGGVQVALYKTRWDYVNGAWTKGSTERRDTVTLAEANKWSAKFEGLETYTVAMENGVVQNAHAYTYSLRELNVPSGFYCQLAYSGLPQHPSEYFTDGNPANPKADAQNARGTATLRNYEIAKLTIEAEKRWGEGAKPENMQDTLTFRLTREKQENGAWVADDSFQAVTRVMSISSLNTSKVVFGTFPKYAVTGFDEQNQPIRQSYRYKVEEVKYQNEATLPFSVSYSPADGFVTTEGDANTSTTVTVTNNKLTSEKEGLYRFNVAKQWLDASGNPADKPTPEGTKAKITVTRTRHAYTPETGWTAETPTAKTIELDTTATYTALWAEWNETQSVYAQYNADGTVKSAWAYTYEVSEATIDGYFGTQHLPADFPKQPSDYFTDAALTDIKEIYRQPLTDTLPEVTEKNYYVERFNVKVDKTWARFRDRDALTFCLIQAKKQLTFDSNGKPIKTDDQQYTYVTKNWTEGGEEPVWEFNNLPKYYFTVNENGEAQKKPYYYYIVEGYETINGALNPYLYQVSYTGDATLVKKTTGAVNQPADGGTANIHAKNLPGYEVGNLNLNLTKEWVNVNEKPEKVTLNLTETTHSWTKEAGWITYDPSESSVEIMPDANGNWTTTQPLEAYSVEYNPDGSIHTAYVYTYELTEAPVNGTMPVYSFSENWPKEVGDVLELNSAGEPIKAKDAFKASSSQMEGSFLVTIADASTTITNVQTGKINIEKKWAAEPAYDGAQNPLGIQKVSISLFRNVWGENWTDSDGVVHYNWCHDPFQQNYVLSAENGWKLTIDNLPLYDTPLNPDGSLRKYRYYIFENTSVGNDTLDRYTPVMTADESELVGSILYITFKDTTENNVTITNVPKSISIVKQWADADTFGEEGMMQDIYLEVMMKYQEVYSTQWKTENLLEKSYFSLENVICTPSSLTAELVQINGAPYLHVSGLAKADEPWRVTIRNLPGYDSASFIIREVELAGYLNNLPDGKLELGFNEIGTITNTPTKLKITKQFKQAYFPAGSESELPLNVRNTVVYLQIWREKRDGAGLTLSQERYTTPLLGTLEANMDATLLPDGTVKLTVGTNTPTDAATLTLTRLPRYWFDKDTGASGEWYYYVKEVDAEGNEVHSASAPTNGERPEINLNVKTLTVTNTLTDISARKVWTSLDNQFTLNPANLPDITLTLKQTTAEAAADGDKTIATVTLGWDAEAGKVVAKNLDGWQFGEVVEYTAPEGSKNIWWGYKWYNLPAYDAGGNIYRYYAKEQTPVGSGWQLVTDDTNATNTAPIPANSENRVFQITNTPITYTLPETGGIGTLPYTAGGLLLMAAAALLLGQEIKRRREGC